MPKLIELRDELDAKRADLRAIFKEAGDDYDMDKVKSLDGDSAAKVEAIRAKNAELDDLTKQVEGLAEIERMKASLGDAPEPGQRPVSPTGAKLDGAPSPEQFKGLGAMFTESEAFKSYKGGGTSGIANLKIGELKTLMDSASGWVPEQTRGPRVVDFATRPLQVLDLIPTGRTVQNAITYMEETTFTNAAAETAEGATYPEAALALTEKQSPVRKIAVWLPVTDEQLEDVEQVRGYIDRRLGFMLKQRLDGQVIAGNGTPPNLRGIVNVAGIQTQAKGADPVPDAVYKAMTKVRVTGRAIPDGIVMHPTDWQGVRLLRTADGIYIWGSPADVGPERMWGLPVAQAETTAAGTSVVGAWKEFSELDYKRDVEIQITNSHVDFFINGKQAIRADVRVAVVYYRPAAFCTVTGL